MGQSILPVVLLVATLLCTLVAGFVLLFAIVVMPGIKTLQNREFLRSFQVIDKVIQDNQPVFLLVWLGSAVTLLIATAMGVWQLEGVTLTLLITATVVYLFGVQLPTIVINIPMNNRVQTLDLDTLDEDSHEHERRLFEDRWNRWNVIRTVLACLAAVLLLTVLRLL